MTWKPFTDGLAWDQLEGEEHHTLAYWHEGYPYGYTDTTPVDGELYVTSYGGDLGEEHHIPTCPQNWTIS